MNAVIATQITLGSIVRTPGYWGFEGKVTRITEDNHYLHMRVADRTGDAEHIMVKKIDTLKVRKLA